MTNHQSNDYRQQRGSHRIFDILEEKSHSISSCHVLRAQQERHALPVVKDNQIYIHIAIKISLQNDNDIKFLPTHRFLGLGEERPHFASMHRIHPASKQRLNQKWPNKSMLQ